MSPSPFQWIPNDILDEAKSLKDSIEWGVKARADAASLWANQQKRDAQKWLDEWNQKRQPEVSGEKGFAEAGQMNGPKALGPRELAASGGQQGIADAFGALNEAARPVTEAIKPAAEFAQEWGPSMALGGIAAPLVKPYVDRIPEALEWEQENVGRPLAEYAAGPGLRNPNDLATRLMEAAAGPALTVAGRFGQEAIEKGPSEAWQAARERWKTSPEPFPGAKGTIEAVVDPVNVLPLPGLQGVARGVKAIDKALPGIAEKAGVMGRRLATEQGGFIHPEGFRGKAEVPTKRYYHGTGSAFDVPDAGKFDPNGLYGPGYYLTDAPEVAGSYARMREMAKSTPHKQRSLQRDIDYEKQQLSESWAQEPGIQEGIKARLRRLQAELDAVNEAGVAGPNVRPIDVPEDLRLLDATARVNVDDLNAILNALPERLRSEFYDEMVFLANQKSGNVTNDLVYDALREIMGKPGAVRQTARMIGDTQRQINTLLSGLGYDGIKHPGGLRTPIKNADDSPVMHNVAVIFTESLPKIRNALSGTQGGFGQVGPALDIGSSAAGGAAGYATADENATPEERLARLAMGAVGGFGLARAARTGRMGAGVEDVSKQPFNAKTTLKGVSPKTGFTKPQEQYLATELGRVAPNLPEKLTPEQKVRINPSSQKAGSKAGYSWAEGTPEGPSASIKVPGDGTVTVYSQEQAHNLQKILGKKPAPPTPEPIKPEGAGEAVTPPSAATKQAQKAGYELTRKDVRQLGLSTSEEDLTLLAKIEDARRTWKREGNGPIYPPLSATGVSPKDFARLKKAGLVEDKGFGPSLSMKGTFQLEHSRGEDLYGLYGKHKAVVEQALSEGKPVPPEVLADYPDLAAKAKPPAEAPKAEPSVGEAKQADVTLFHGTNADFADPEIATGKKMFGIHLTTDAEAAAEYGKVKTYSLAADAKVLDLSDGDDLWEFMRKNEILDADDLDNVDLENYVKSGQLYQYDVSSRTHFADYVARQAQSMGYDVVKMIDNLRGLGDDTAYVVVNPKALKSLQAKPPAEASRVEPPVGEAPAGYVGAINPVTADQFLESLSPTMRENPEVKAVVERLRATENAKVEPPIGEPTPPATGEVPPVVLPGRTAPPTIGTGAARGQARRGGPLPAQQTAPPATPPATPSGPTPAVPTPVTGPPQPPTPQTTNPPRGDNWLPDIKKNPELDSLAYQDDAIRRVTDKFDNVITRNVLQALGEPMKDIFTKGLVVWQTVKSDWSSGVVGAMARVRELGPSDKLFKVDKDGYANIGGQRIAAGDVAQYPDRYPLNAEQKEYARRTWHLLDDMKERLTQNGIDVKELLMEQGGHWVPRKAMGKLGANGEIEMAQVGSGSGGRVGAKASFEKRRSFKTEQEALDAGYRYLSIEEAVESALQAAGRKIADQRLIDLILPQIPYRTGAAPEALRLAKDHAVEKLRALHNLKSVINRGYRGERVPDATVASIGRFFPNEAGILLQAGITKPENPLTRALLQQAEAAIPGLKTQASQEANRARNAFTKAREKTMKPKMGESTVQVPAFQGKFFSDEDARKLQTIMDIQPLPSRGTQLIRGGAEAVSAINSVPRLLQATYDLGTPFIQGMPTLFYRPIEWSKAYKQSLAALRSPAARDAYYAANADDIKWMSERGLNLMRSEFSQALERGSLTQRGIHAVPVLGRITEAASRGYETYLNALKIEGVKATRAMASTPQEERALMKFWNDMAGTPDTAVQGISATQRSLETAALYAPRYWRSGLSLMTSIARGGIRGDQARAAVSHLIVGGLMGYVGVSYLLGQTPKLDPTDRRFLTVNILGQDVGIGSTFFTLNRALLRMALHPEKTHEIAGDYVTSKGSPLISTIKSAPYYRGGVLEITGQIIKKNLLPFSLQSMLLERHEDAGAAAVAGAAGFLGGRTVQPEKQQGSSKFKYPGPPTGNIGPKVPTGPKYIYPGR